MAALHGLGRIPLHDMFRGAHQSSHRHRSSTRRAGQGTPSTEPSHPSHFTHVLCSLPATVALRTAPPRAVSDHDRGIASHRHGARFPMRSALPGGAYPRRRVCQVNQVTDHKFCLAVCRHALDGRYQTDRATLAPRSGCLWPLGRANLCSPAPTQARWMEPMGRPCQHVPTLLAFPRPPH